jgi:hypothetical protein
MLDQVQQLLRVLVFDFTKDTLRLVFDKELSAKTFGGLLFRQEIAAQNIHNQKSTINWQLLR